MTNSFYKLISIQPFNLPMEQKMKLLLKVSTNKKKTPEEIEFFTEDGINFHKAISTEIYRMLRLTNAENDIVLEEPDAMINLSLIHGKIKKAQTLFQYNA